MLPGRLIAHRQVLVARRPRRQCLWRSESGVLVSAGGGLRGGGRVKSGRDQPPAFRVPSPQVIVGQFGAAPPAMDGVVTAEIVGAGKNRVAEIGQRERAVLVAREALV